MNTTPLHRAINAALFVPERAINALTIDLPAEVPEWVELIPAGRFSGRDGRGPWFSDIPVILQAFASDQSGSIEPVVDYDHQSCVVLQTGEKAEAAGWIKQLEERAGAIWGRVEWLPEAAQDITGRRYRYLSPVFDYDATGRIVKLISVGLANALSSQQQQTKETEIDQVVDQAIADGKVAPANRGYFRAQASADLAAFKTFVAGAPVIAAPANTQRAANSQQERQQGENPLIANAKARSKATQ